MGLGETADIWFTWELLLWPSLQNVEEERNSNYCGSGLDTSLYWPALSSA